MRGRQDIPGVQPGAGIPPGWLRTILWSSAVLSLALVAFTTPERGCAALAAEATCGPVMAGLERLTVLTLAFWVLAGAGVLIAGSIEFLLRAVRWFGLELIPYRWYRSR